MSFPLVFARPALALAAPWLALLAACGAGGGGDEPATAGPCVHTYAEPVLLIDDARAAGGAAGIGTLSIEVLSLDGRAVDAAALLVTATGIRQQGQTLQCTTPCGFGNAAGAYVLRAQAAGYAAQELRVDARYATVTGGCPSSSSGGTRLSLVMTPG